MMNQKIAFLGLGRMGQQLVAHLIEDGLDVTVWNRSPNVAEQVAATGATLGASAADAVREADVVITVLFGPDAIGDVILNGDLPFAPDATWIDVTTIGPAEATGFQTWAHAHHLRYAYSPVIGSLGPARQRQLGVLIGGTDDAIAVARPIVSRWADPARLTIYDAPSKAAAGKLVANVALAVTMQGLIEALRIGRGGGLSAAEVIARCLDKTALATIATLKGDTLLKGTFTDTQFSVDALAKDARLMIATATEPLPALTAALNAFLTVQREGHGDDDFSVIGAADTRSASSGSTH
jgi:3-hydroxyisobutyrate dehydrogenase